MSRADIESFNCDCPNGFSGDLCEIKSGLSTMNMVFIAIGALSILGGATVLGLNIKNAEANKKASKNKVKQAVMGSKSHGKGKKSSGGDGKKGRRKKGEAGSSGRKRRKR